MTIRLDAISRVKALILFVGFVALTVGACVLASKIQTDYGRIDVTNVQFANKHGVAVRGKLFHPKSVTQKRSAPGVVFIPGYQSLRESGDAVSIELARRGFVVLAIDAIGRGNSGVPPSDLNDPTFDPSFGGHAALKYLKSIPAVNPDAVAMAGHSLGAQMAYLVGLSDPTVKAVVMIGSAYNEEVTPNRPSNLLMAFGKYDEFRDRMTQTNDFEAEWMQSEQTKAAFGTSDAKFWTTYGDFKAGTARRVIAPSTVHQLELHNRAVVAETVSWMQQALIGTKNSALPTTDQIWALKEWATLVALIAAFAALFPLALLLIQIPPFSKLRLSRPFEYHCPISEFTWHASINGVLMWFYIPASIVVFAVHRYVVKIDGALPMMVVNVVVLWLLVTNFIGFLLTRRWARRHPKDTGVLLYDIGLRFYKNKKGINWQVLGNSILFAGLLFGCVYLFEFFLEQRFIVDLRFIYSFANDLTPYRWEMFALYFPLFLICFIQLCLFLHGQIRLEAHVSPVKTFTVWSMTNFFVLAIPMLLLAAVQYLPLLSIGAIPLVGPGGMFVLFVINIAHIIGVLAIIVPLSTWLYILTGRPWVGALLIAAIVTWMFASSQTIAPVPIK